MRDFAAIDFETANNERTSVCSVGVVIVRDGEIVDTFYSLIQPEPNYYNYTIIIGVARYMVLLVRTQKKPPYSQKYGNR